MFRTFARALTAALLTLGTAHAADEPRVREIPQEFLKSVPPQQIDPLDGRERPQASLDGMSLTVLAPLYEHTGDNISYVRFYNQRSTTSRIGVLVVGTPTGRVYGSNVFVTVPPHASVQLPYTEILQRAGIARGAYVGSDNGFSFYMTAGSTSGQSYQHIIHSGTTGFFENMTVCQWDETGIEGLLEASLMNVHTTGPYMTEYPSLISFHHYGSGPARYRVSIYNSTSGTLVDNYTFTIDQGETFVADAEWYQDSWTPADVDSHMNIVFRRDDGGTFQGVPAHYVLNQRVNGVINMTQHCAIGYDP